MMSREETAIHKNILIDIEGNLLASCRITFSEHVQNFITMVMLEWYACSGFEKKMMSKLFKIMVSVSAVFLVGFGVLAFHSYQSLTFMNHGLRWFWVDSQLISFNDHAMQSAREHHSNQLIYRQVDIGHHLAVFLNTTNNGFFLFTFVKDAPCDDKSPIQATLQVNEAPSETVKFICQTANSAVYRIAKPDFHQLQLANNDFQFDLSGESWDFDALKKDDYMQRNYRFFQKHSGETVSPWDRD